LVGRAEHQGFSPRCENAKGPLTFGELNKVTQILENEKGGIAMQPDTMMFVGLLVFDLWWWLRK